MKKQALTVVLGFSILMFLAGISVFAQSGDEQIDVNVPFAFVVGKTTLPAGSYIIRSVDEADQVAMVIRSVDGRMAVDFLTDSIETGAAPNDTHIVFEEINGKQVLSQIWVQADNIGRQVVEPASILGSGHATRTVKAHHSKHAR